MSDNLKSRVDVFGAQTFKDESIEFPWQNIYFILSLALASTNKAQRGLEKDTEVNKMPMLSKFGKKNSPFDVVGM